MPMGRKLHYTSHITFKRVHQHQPSELSAACVPLAACDVLSLLAIGSSEHLSPGESSPSSLLSSATACSEASRGSAGVGGGCERALTTRSQTCRTGSSSSSVPMRRKSLAEASRRGASIPINLWAVRRHRLRHGQVAPTCEVEDAEARVLNLRHLAGSTPCSRCRAASVRMTM